MLVEERDERGAEALVRRVDQLLAGLLAPLDGDGLADQRDDVGAAREGQARGAPEEAQRGARLAGELPGAGEGEELGGAEVVDRDEVCIFFICGGFFVFERFGKAGKKTKRTKGRKEERKGEKEAGRRGKRKRCFSLFVAAATPTPLLFLPIFSLSISQKSPSSFPLFFLPFPAWIAALTNPFLFFRYTLSWCLVGPRKIPATPSTITPTEFSRSRSSITGLSAGWQPSHANTCL